MDDKVSIENLALNPHGSNARYDGRAIWLVVVFLCVLLIVFNETAWSIVSTWIRSETFTHGFLIIPIVLWMIWERRLQLLTVTARPEYRALILLACSGFVWLLASQVDVLVIQQYALVAMALFGLWTILGNQVCWLISFPLVYLLFLVPAGEGLVPVMMEFTATFTVEMVKLSGIPVYREGMYFFLPSGNWSVVEACSGVRYLIASVTLGCLYAYLTYSSIQKRLVFILISFIVPVVANGLRAYMIVMLGHWSDMTIATGVDHLIYGWIFFGVVMLLLFSIGGMWRDQPVESESSVTVQNDSDFESAKTNFVKSDSPRTNRFPSLCLASVLAFAVVAVWPLLAIAMKQPVVSIHGESLRLPEKIADWQQSASFPSATTASKINDLAQSTSDYWQPAAGGAPRVASLSYERQEQVVSLTLHQFLHQQSQGDELVSNQNLLLPDGESRWRVAARSKLAIVLPDGVLPIEQSRLIDGYGEELLVWSWYRIGYRYSANDYQAKLFEALAILTFGRQDAARIFLATQVSGGAVGEPDAALVLKKFLEAALPDMISTLDQSVGLE